MLGLKFSKNNKMRKRVYWWEPKDGIHNAGDHLAKIIVQQMLVLRDKEILEKISAKNKLLSIGSVMHFANDGDSIWGTGVNGKISVDKLKFSNLDVRAVRGPKTRQVLQEKGIEVPETYGDPALLLPKLFNKKILIDDNLQCETLIIPHMNEDFNKYKKYAHMLCSPRQGALNFTRRIVNSSFVISSSLHGVIIAEAYGIPAVFLNGESGESMFKYDDYYNGTDRDYYPIAKEVEQAFKLRLAEPIDVDNIVPKLFNAFPYDLWDVSNS